MARAEKFWIDFYNLFRADEVLADRRSDAFYQERDGDLFRSMEKDFSRDLVGAHSLIGFLSGQRGSGKSTFLLHWLNTVKQDYFVVYCSVLQNLALAQTNQIDVLYLLGTAIFKTAREEGLKLSDDLLKDLATAVYSVAYPEQKAKEMGRSVLASVTEVAAFGASAFAGGLGEKLVQAAGKVALSSGIAESVARKHETLEPQLQVIINAINALVGEVEAQIDYRPLLVVVDDLDKLPRLEQASLIFWESPALRSPSCRVIYTAPLLAFRELEFGQTAGNSRSYLLPNVKLFERAASHNPYQPGYDIMRGVARRRLTVLSLTNEDMFEKDALDLLILKSGGIMRLFIELIYRAGQKASIRQEKSGAAQQKIILSDAVQSADDQAAEWGFRLTIEMVEELKKVRRTHRLPDTELARRLLHANFIVAYRNRQRWFDAHPLLWEELETP